MMGPPLFEDAPIPTWEEFIADYSDNFFDGTTPELEASYIIEVSGDSLGQINYEVRDKPIRLAELDIWLRSLADTGHGYGPDPLIALTDHLFGTLGIATFVIRPSLRNHRAVRAYERVGFCLVPMTDTEQTEAYGAGDYEDSVVMVKRISA